MSLLKELHVAIMRPARYPSLPAFGLSLLMLALGTYGLVVNAGTGHWFLALLFVVILGIYGKLTIAYWPGRQ